MIVSTMTAITDWEGTILTKRHFGVDSTNPANLGFVLVTALSTPYPDEKNLSAEEKLNRYELALHIRKSEEVELTSEEVVLLKKCAAKLAPVLVYGQIARILEGKDTGLSAKPEVAGTKEELAEPTPPPIEEITETDVSDSDVETKENKLEEDEKAENAEG